jgi:hypothetical protein
MRASRVVARMLGVRHGHQDRVVLCRVDHLKYSRVLHCVPCYAIHSWVSRVSFRCSKAW